MSIVKLFISDVFGILPIGTEPAFCKTLLKFDLNNNLYLVQMINIVKNSKNIAFSFTHRGVPGGSAGGIRGVGVRRGAGRARAPRQGVHQIFTDKSKKRFFEPNGF